MFQFAFRRISNFFALIGQLPKTKTKKSHTLNFSITIFWLKCPFIWIFVTHATTLTRNGNCSVAHRSICMTRRLKWGSCCLIMYSTRVLWFGRENFCYARISAYFAYLYFWRVLVYFVSTGNYAYSYNRVKA